MNLNFTPWSTAVPFAAAPITWISDLDNQRIQSYSLYEQMYWSVPDAFKLVLRGTEDDGNPIYVPSPKVIIEGVNRFLGKGFDYWIDPNVDTGNVEAARLLMAGMFKREQIYAKFSTQKRFGLIRGDAVWHVVADPLKEAGQRISWHEVDPASYFPIYDLDKPDRRIGCHLAETFVDVAQNVVLTRRQTYRKDPETGRVTTEAALYEQNKWDDRNVKNEIKLLQVITPLTELDPRITQIPVYHIKNTRTPMGDFGSSELRGLERIAAAVNQSITDEEMALALAGLGVYTTDSGPPINDDGDAVDWILGPGRVVERSPDSTFDRVQGIGTVTPSQDHIQFLLAEMRRSAGLSDTAVGRVDVQVAESGVALALELAPVLAMNEEKEQEMLSVYDHMFYDIIRAWLPVYEGLTSDINIGAVVRDPMPVNRDKRIDEIIKLATSTPPMLSMAYARQELQKLGYEDLPTTMDNDVIAETIAMNEAVGSDPYAERLRAELDSTGAPSA